MKSYIEQFLKFIKTSKNASPHTVRNYDIDLTDFQEFLKKFPVETIQRKTLRSYLADLAARQKSKATIARKLSCLRAFFKFLFVQKIYDYNPAEDLDNPKLDKKLPIFLTYEQVNHLFNLPDTSTLFGFRDRTIMELLYSSGLRVSELTGLNRSAIYFEECCLRLRGKGKKERIVPVTQNALDWIMRYLNHQERLENDPEAVFLNKHGTRLTTRSVDRLFAKYLTASGLSAHITPHLIRHTIATHWLENGMDLKTIQTLLGHSALTTTTIYTQVTTKLKRKVYDAAHPRAH